MLDLHCHLLPAVDDGAADTPTALAMAEALLRAGFTAIAASPHFGEGPGGDVARAKAAAARAALTETLERAKLPLEVLPNAEHHVTPRLFERLAEGDVTPLGGAGSWLLVELPWQAVPDVEGVLFRLQVKGRRLLLAHPERYTYLEPAFCGRLVERGVRLQLEIGSFAGLYGKRAQIRAQAIADAGWGHVLATDLHRPDDAETWIRHALAKVADRYGQRALDLALRDNPRRITADSPTEAVPSFCAGRGDPTP